MSGMSPRNDGSQNIHFLRKATTAADQGSVITVGVVPAGSLILKPLSGIHITTAYTAGTNHQYDIGTSDNDDLFGTNLDVSTATFVPLDEAVGDYYVTANTTITATPDLTGTSATVGAGIIVIAYVPNNDR